MSPSLAPILQEFLKSAQEATGCVVVVIGPGGKRSEAAAGHDGTGRGLSIGATFRIASVTKTFTAAAILRLSEQGSLRLDDSLSNFLEPDLVEVLSVVGGRSFGQEISIRHLLQHTSGINAVDGADVLDLLAPNLPAWALPRDARGQVEFAVRSGPPYGLPGERFHYSDTNYVLLSLILEHLTNKPWAAALRDLCNFDGLDLKVLYVERLEAPRQVESLMRHFVGTRDLTDIDPTFDIFGSGGIVSDCRDLAVWWHALFNGQILSSGSLEEMMATIPDPSGGREIGLGLFRRTYHGIPVWYHSGGWGCFALHQAEAGLTIVASTNQAIDSLPPGGFEMLRGELLRATLNNTSSL